MHIAFLYVGRVNVAEIGASVHEPPLADTGKTGNMPASVEPGGHWQGGGGTAAQVERLCSRDDQADSGDLRGSVKVWDWRACQCRDGSRCQCRKGGHWQSGGACQCQDEHESFHRTRFPSRL